MTLAVSVEEIGPARVLKLVGRVVYGPECEVLLAEGRSQLQQTSVILLDLSRVVAIDSSGVGAIVRLLTTARSRSRSLHLIAPSSKVQEVLRLTKLLRLFEVYTDAKEFEGKERVKAKAQSA